MPWRAPPHKAGRNRDARLDPYRERGARLSSHDRDWNGTLFVRVETWSEQLGGHLWWRDWSDPYEVVHSYVRFSDGWSDDWIVGRDHLDGELGDWKQNKLVYLGKVIGIEWLDDTTSLEVRDREFGLGAP